MPFQIVRNDITRMKTDAIVNAANNSLLGGGGVDGAIHRAAGPELLAECKTLHGCATGDAKLTKGYRLPCKYVIHTVGPIWNGGHCGEDELLASCYRKSLELAEANGCESIAFPLISAGAYGYPKEEALKIAADTIGAFLENHELEVYLVVFDRNSFSLSRDLMGRIDAYINDHYVEEHAIRRRNRRLEEECCFDVMPEREPLGAQYLREEYAPEQCAPIRPAAARKALDLDSMLQHKEKTFSELLFSMIDEKGLTDVYCYRKANLTRKHFSKIRIDKNYHPKKSTVMSLAMALQLTLPEVKKLLASAGYALSPSSRVDIIYEYFIVSGNYSLIDLDLALYQYEGTSLPET